MPRFQPCLHVTRPSASQSLHSFQPQDEEKVGSPERQISEICQVREQTCWNGSKTLLPGLEPPQPVSSRPQVSYTLMGTPGPHVCIVSGSLFSLFLQMNSSSSRSGCFSNNASSETPAGAPADHLLSHQRGTPSGTVAATCLFVRGNGDRPALDINMYRPMNPYQPMRITWTLQNGLTLETLSTITHVTPPDIWWPNLQFCLRFLIRGYGRTQPVSPMSMDPTPVQGMIPKGLPNVEKRIRPFSDSGTV